MHPRTEELLDHLAYHRVELRRAVDAVPSELREQRPAPHRWSVAEVIEHLAIVESRFAPRFASQVAAARADGLAAETETTPVVPTAPMELVVRRTRPVTAPDATRPLGKADGTVRLGCARDGGGGSLRGATQGRWARTRATLHAASLFCELNLYQMIAVLGGHEARHAAQIREIGMQLGAATTSA